MMTDELHPFDHWIKVIKDHIDFLLNAEKHWRIGYDGIPPEGAAEILSLLEITHKQLHDYHESQYAKFLDRRGPLPLYREPEWVQERRRALYGAQPAHRAAAPATQKRPKRKPSLEPSAPPARPRARAKRR